jgi:hypothetical protein
MQSTARLTTDKNNDLSWVVRSETPTANKYFPARAWIKINKDGIVAESVESVGVAAPSDELREYALRQSSKMPCTVKLTSNATAPKKYQNLSRSTCIECGLPVAYPGCKYCTDCHGEF